MGHPPSRLLAVLPSTAVIFASVLSLGAEAGALQVPEPNLEHFDASVQAQIEGLSTTLRRLSVDDAIAPAELARGFESLGHLYLAYEMWDEALLCYANAKRLSPGESDWSYFEATAHRRAGRLARAAAGRPFGP